MKRPAKDAAAIRLEGLLEAGDLRAARAEGQRLLGGDPRPEDRALAEEALLRSTPERGAAVAAALGIALFVAAALLGILSHR